MIPEKLRVFETQIATALKNLAGLVVLINRGLLRADDPRIDEMLAGVDALNERLDRLSACMGRMLEVQMAEWAERVKG